MSNYSIFDRKKKNKDEDDLESILRDVGGPAPSSRPNTSSTKVDPVIPANSASTVRPSRTLRYVPEDIKKQATTRENLQSASSTFGAPGESAANESKSPVRPGKNDDKTESTKTSYSDQFDQAFAAYSKESDEFYKQFKDDPANFEAAAKQLSDTFKQDLSDAQAVYQNSRDSEAASKLWSKIIDGIGHIVAGAVGLRTGLDLSGVQFSKEDWDARMANIQRELGMAKEDAYRKLTDGQRQLADKRANRNALLSLQQSQFDRAQQTETTRLRILQDEKRAEERKQADSNDAIKKMLAGKIDEQRKQDVKSYNRSLQNVDQLLDKYAKDEDKKIAQQLINEMELVRRFENKLGFDPVFPGEIPQKKDVSSWNIFARQYPTLQEFLRSRRQVTSEAGASEVDQGTTNPDDKWLNQGFKKTKDQKTGEKFWWKPDPTGKNPKGITYARD